MISYLLLFISGLVGGVLAGLIGIGGGIIYILVLEHYFVLTGLDSSLVAQYTIANSVFAVFFATFSSSIALVQSGRFFWRPVVIASLGSIVLSLLLLNFYVNTEFYNQLYFSVIIVLLLIYMLYRVYQDANDESTKNEIGSVKNLLLLGTGASGGATSALSGLGGGVVMVPFLNIFGKVNIKSSRSVSLGVIAITSLIMTMSNLLEKTPQIYDYQSGFVVLPVCGMISLGVMIGGPVGVKIGERIPNRAISYVYGAFLTIYLIIKIFEIAKWLLY